MSRGGKREGAGRPKGALTERTRQVAERAIAEGKAPLEVMLDNMTHFQQVALDAEAIVEGMTAEEMSGKSLEPIEQFKLLLAQVKKAAGFRQMAHECARDAAAYMHAKLASIEHSGNVNVSHEDALEQLDRPAPGDSAETSGRSSALRGELPENSNKGRLN